jgi:CRISPR-associated protein Cmr3
VNFPTQEIAPEELAKIQNWERRRAVLATTQDYCQDVFWSERGSQARQYLVAERGLTEEEIRTLPSIGYYPCAAELKKYLTSKGFTKEDWRGTGCVWNEMEGYITFLWNDANGRPLTIYGRYKEKNPPNGKPKTIATPGEKTKSSPLYFDLALKAGHKESILVEGVLDAVLLQAKGDTRVCAYVAASLSGDQIAAIKRRSVEKVTLCGDPDYGGDRGTNSNLVRLTEAGIGVYIAPKLPDGLDPDEFLLREGMEGWRKHIDAAEHGFRWKARRLIESGNVSTDKGKAQIIKEAIAFCQVVKNHSDLDLFFWPTIRSALSMESNEFRAQLEALFESSLTDVVKVGGSSCGSGGDGGNKKPPMEELSLRDRILEILNRHQGQSERNEALINLAQTTRVSHRDIKELALSIEAEVDLDESRTDRKTEVEKLLKIGKYGLNLFGYLPMVVATPLEKIAEWMGTTSAAMLVTLYPTIASLLKVGTRLELIEATDFYALPIVYSGVVAESGSGKSPAQKAILKPLFALQAEADEQYKQRLADYEAEWEQWKKSKDENKGPAPEKPFVREYYTNDATREAIALILSQQPEHGLLGYPDELAALFKSQGEYKGGRGADKEALLSGRDGTNLKVNRAGGKRINVAATYSITGSIQPDVLRKMMGDFNDPCGEWARFLWTVMPVMPAPYPDNATSQNLSQLLKSIYQRLSNLPATTYKLSQQASSLYHDWYNELDQLKLAESRQGLRAVYAKMKGDTGILALLLHCFNGCATEDESPERYVSASTMKAAIRLAKYHIGQVKLVHAEGDAANGDIAAIHAKIIQLSERKGWLKAADVRDMDRQTKKKFTPSDIRAHFKELEASGFGQCQGEGTRLMWTIHCPKSPDDSSPPPSGPTQDSEEKLRENSELVQDSVVTTESITPNVLPPTSDKTQDSFSASAQELGDSRGVNEIKDAAPNEDVANCPEIESSSQNKETVGMTAQETTQDTSPETVLSCPEGSFLSDPTPATGKEFKPHDAVALVADPTQIGEVLYFNPNWNEYNVAFLIAGMTNYYKPAELIKVVPRSGARIQYKVFTGELVSKVASGWHVRWEVVSKSFKKRFGNPPAIVKESEFKLI